MPTLPTHPEYIDAHTSPPHTHIHAHMYLRHSTAQQSEVSRDEQRCFSQQSTVYRPQPNLVLGTGHNVALGTTKWWKR